MDRQQKQQLKVDALGLDIDMSTYDIPCPCCGESGSFSVTRTREGLLYNCFRASCPTKGFIPSMGASLYHASELPRKKLKPYKGELQSIHEELYRHLERKYGLAHDTIDDNGWLYEQAHHRLYMPVINIYGKQVGAVCKMLDGSDYTGPKAVLYTDVESDTYMHFPTYCSYSGDRIVVVEDSISATKVSLVENCCALLGTHVNDCQVGLLASNFDNIVFLLDPDATDKAIKLTKEYGAMFRSSSVIVLQADPKDTSVELLRSTLYV